MAVSITALTARIAADTSDYDRGMKHVRDQADSTSGHVGGAFGKLGGLFSALGGLGLGVMGLKVLGEGVAGLASGMVSGNAEFERYETQFGVLLGSAKAAKDRLAELAEFGAKTPFELPEVVRADKILTAFGLDSETTAARFGVSAQQIRTTIGDVASGTGASFEELSVTFGKFASGATGEAIARFQEMGIATREEMAGWGLEFAKSGQLLTPAREAFTVLEKHVRAKFGGMMEAQSSTFEGMMSNLSDWFGQAKRQMMAPLFEVLKDKLKLVLDFLGSPAAKAALDGFAKAIAGGIAGAIDAVGRAADFLGSAFSTLEGILWPILDELAFLLDLDPGAYGNAWEEFAGIFGHLAGVFRDFFMGGADLGHFAEWLQETFEIDISPVVDLQRALSDLGRTVFDVVGRLGDVLSGKVSLSDWISESIPKLTGAYGNYMATLFGLLQQTGAWLWGQVQQWGAAFVGWISPMIAPALAQLSAWATQLWAWVQAQAPVWLAQLATWGKAFVDWIGPMIPPFLAELGRLAGQFIAWIGEQVPPLLAQLGEWANAFVAWVVPAAIQFLNEWPAVLDSFLTWIGEAVGPIVKQLLDWALAFVTWIIPNIPNILGALAAVAAAIVVFILETAVVLGGKLVEWGNALIAWVGDALPKLLEALGTVWDAMSTWLGETLAKLVDKGKELGVGLVEGIKAGLRSVTIPIPAFWIEMVEVLDVLGQKISMPKLGVGLEWRKIADLFPNFDQGGIVPGPLGAPVLAVVHGGETITPVGRQASQGGVVVNFNGNFAIANQEDIEVLAYRVATEIQRRRR